MRPLQNRIEAAITNIIGGLPTNNLPQWIVQQWIDCVAKQTVKENSRGVVRKDEISVTGKVYLLAQAYTAHILITHHNQAKVLYISLILT